MTYPQMDPRRLDLTGSFGLRVAGRDAAEVRIGTAGRWGQRVNLHTDPRATRPEAPSGKFGWAAPGYSTGGVGTWTSVTASDGPLPDLVTYVRQAWTVAPTAIPAWSVGVHLSVANLAAAPVDAEGQYTFSFWSRPSFDIPSAYAIAQFYDSTGTLIGGAPVLPVSFAADQWTRIAFTVTPPVNAVTWRPYWQNRVALSADAIQVGSSLDATGALVEKSSDLGDYFDGDTPDTPAALHHWTATPHESTSVQTLAWTPGD